MDNSSSGYLILCMVCGIPFVAGSLSTFVVLARVARLGMPWALIPFGGTIKRMIHERND